MRSTGWRFGLLLTFVCAGEIANADVLSVYDGFNYTPGLSLNGQSGGFGWSGAWFTPGGLDATVDSSSLTPGSLGVSGGAVSTQGFQPPNQGSSVATWIRDLATPLGANGTTAYLSFLLQPDAGAGFYGGLNFGGVFVGLSGNQSFYGLEGPANDLSLSSVPAVQGQPVLLVLQVNFFAGDDQLSLYVNPIAGDPQPAVPNAVKTNLDVGAVDSVTINNYGGFAVDEVRIGDSFAAVTPTPAVPEPRSGVLLGFMSAALLIINARRKRVSALTQGFTTIFPTPSR
jgi:hypothetical protein